MSSGCFNLLESNIPRWLIRLGFPSNLMSHLNSHIIHGESSQKQGLQDDGPQSGHTGWMSDMD